MTSLPLLPVLLKDLCDSSKGSCEIQPHYSINGPNTYLNVIILHTKYVHLIIINITNISMFRNYSFNFGWNVMKRGRNMERRKKHNIAKPKLELKLFCPSC